jgi:hypothetical protein
MLSSVALAAAHAGAADLTDNLARVTAGTERVTTERRLAAGFSTDAGAAYRLSSVTLPLANPDPGTAALDLYSDGGLEPGTPIATLTPPASYSSTPAATTFSAGGVALEAGTMYWVVLRAQSGTFYWAWTADNSGSGVGFESVWDASEDAGASWYAFDVYPLQLKVTVNAPDATGRFHRGDPDSSGTTDLSDGITIFGFLFLGDPAALSCRESADANNDGEIDITDGIYLLEWLFLGGPEPPSPGSIQSPCGVDPDPAGSAGDLGCGGYDHCN